MSLHERLNNKKNTKHFQANPFKNESVRRSSCIGPIVSPVRHPVMMKMADLFTSANSSKRLSYTLFHSTSCNLALLKKVIGG